MLNIWLGPLHPHLDAPHHIGVPFLPLHVTLAPQPSRRASVRELGVGGLLLPTPSS
jgi:hypothetical protein